MLNSLKSYGLILLFFILLAVGVFRCVLGADRVFSGSDANIGMLTVNQRQLPEKFSGGYGPSPLLGGAGIAPITVSNLGKTILSPSLFSDTWYSIYLIISSMALVAYLRQWGVRWLCAVLGALAAFWVGSVTLAAVGHLYKLGVMAFFMSSLFFLEKSVRASGWKCLGWSSLAGVGVGLMLLEQQDVGLLAGLFLGAYAVFRLVQEAGCCWQKWLQVLVPIAMVGIALSASTAQKSYTTNVMQTGIDRDPAQKWEYITQWSMVPSELSDLIAPGRTGWKTNDPDGPYWGICGQSAEWKSTGQGFRNFKLDCLYIGFIPVFFGLWGFIFSIGKAKTRRDSIFVFWGVAGVVALLLAFGKFTPVYKLFYQLPLVNNIRAPSKFMHNLQVIIGIMAAYGLHRLIECPDENRKKYYTLMFWSGVIALVGMVFAALGAGMDSYAVQFKEWGQHATVIAGNVARAWWHAAAVTLIMCGVIFLRIKRPVIPVWILPLVLGACIIFDSLFITKRYFHALDLATLKKGNVVINFLKENQGNERIAFLEQSQIYNSWLGLDVMFHGLNTFNIWQMSRMPAEYKEYLKTIGRNQIRLWQLASVKYVTAPASLLQQFDANPRSKEMFEPVMFYRFGMQKDALATMPIQNPEHAQDQVLLRFKTHVPRFSLYHDWKKLPLEEHCGTLVDDTFDPRTTVLVDADLELLPTGAAFETVEAQTTIKDAVVKTSSTGNGVLMFTQRFQNGWSVTVDGRPAKLFRCNYLCMGVQVPAGQHEVRFKYK